MTARPRRDGGQEDGGGRVMLGKAVVIAVVGVVLGVLAIQAGQHDASTATTTTTTTTTSTTVPPGGTTTTTTTGGGTAKTTTTTVGTAAPSASVKVEVLNASSRDGVAGYYTGQLHTAGWGTVTPKTATTEVATTVIYYATGQQAAANGVAKTLSLTASSVQAISSSTPVGHPTPAAAVLVVIGNDLGGQGVGQHNLTPAVALPAGLRPVRDRLFEAAVFLDYDGTLAPIVTDPSLAVPVPGVPGVLAGLGREAGLVAVVSGRPVAYLAEQLGRWPGVHLAGLYGMEEATGDGPTLVAPALDRWRPVVHAAAVRLAATVPPGVVVEEKGLAVTVHWRRSPAAEDAAMAAARAAAAPSAAVEGPPGDGLVAHPGRMSVELRPPVGIDKGTVVLRLGAAHPVLACFGDDLGDLPAFAAADRLAATTGAIAVKVAVADAETAPAVLEAADLCLDGPAAAVEVLGALLSR